MSSSSAGLEEIKQHDRWCKHGLHSTMLWVFGLSTSCWHNTHDSCESKAIFKICREQVTLTTVHYAIIMLGLEFLRRIGVYFLRMK